MQALLWVYKGLVVVIREGCACLEGRKLKSMILMIGCDGIFIEARVLSYFLKVIEKSKSLILNLNKGVQW